MMWRRGRSDREAEDPDSEDRDAEERDAGDPDAGDPDAGDPDAGDRGTDQPADRRRALIDLVIYAYDRTTSGAIRARLAEGLAAVGVVTVQPDGEPFDPARHEAGGTEPTDDQARHGTVAETERAGFTDGDRIIRDPVVVVFRRR